MQNTKKLTKKAISVLMSIVMVLTALQPLSVPAQAQTTNLTDALNGYAASGSPGLSITGTGGSPWNSSQNVPHLSANDLNNRPAAYAGYFNWYNASSTLSNAPETVFEVVQSIGALAAANPNTLPTALPGVPAAFIGGVTAAQLAGFNHSIVMGGHNYNVYPPYNLNAPNVSTGTNTIGVNVTRSAVQALMGAAWTSAHYSAGTNGKPVAVDSIPASLFTAYSVMWNVRIYCNAVSANDTDRCDGVNGCNDCGGCTVRSSYLYQNASAPAVNSTPVDGTAYKALLTDYRDAMMVPTGSGVPATAWRDLTEADIFAMDKSQLYTLLGKLGPLLYYGVADSLGADTDGVLAAYGLPPYARLKEFYDLVEGLHEVYDDLWGYANYFHAPDTGKIPTAPTSAFMAVVQENQFADPRGIYNTIDDGTLDALYQLYAEASIKDKYLQGIYDYNSGKWNDLVIAAQNYVGGSYTLDVTALANQKKFLANLNWIVMLWEAWDVRDAIDYLLVNCNDIHVGVNPNDPDGVTLTTNGWTNIWDAWDEAHPDDDSGPFGDSNYKLPDEALDFYYNQILYFEEWVGKQNEDYKALYPPATQSAIIDQVINDLGGFGYAHGYVPLLGRWGDMNTRKVDIFDELDYRWGEDWSERSWYSFRDYFTPMLANPAVLNSYSNAQLMNLLSGNQTPHPNAPNPPYMEYLANRTEYYARQAAAQAALGSKYGDESGVFLWQEIYGDIVAGKSYADLVIEPTYRHIVDVLAARVTDDVESLVLRVMNSNPAQNTTRAFPVHTRSSGLAPDYGQYYVNIDNYAALRSAIQRVQPTGDTQAMVNFLQNLPGDERTSLGRDNYAETTAAKNHQYVLDDILWLRSLLADIEHFISHPMDYYTQSYWGPPARDEWKGTLNGKLSADIVPGHQYADVGVLGTKQATYWGGPYKHNASVPGVDQTDGPLPTPLNPVGQNSRYDGEDAAMNALIDRLDYVLGSGGNFLPLLQMLGADGALGELLGDLGDGANLKSLIDALLGNVLYTDKTLNAIVGLLMPTLLNLFEDTVMVDTLVKEVAKLDAGGIPKLYIEIISGSGWGNGAWLSGSLWELTNFERHGGGTSPTSNPFSLGTEANRNQTFSQLKLYPDLMAKVIDQSKFLAVYNKLAAATKANDTGALWRNGPNGAYRPHFSPDGVGPPASTGTPYRGNGKNGANNTWMQLAYPTRAWAQNKSPSLYEWNPEAKDGAGDWEFYLPWYIDTTDGTTPRPVEDREARFFDALSNVFASFWPLVNALFLGNNVTLDCKSAAFARAPIGIDGNGTASVYAVNITLNVGGIFNKDASGNKTTLGGAPILLAQILTPIYEALLGEDIDVVNTIKQFQDKGRQWYDYNTPTYYPTNAQIRTMARDAVSILLDPIYEFVDRLAERPVTEILNLLPNLAYALNFKRIGPLLEGLGIGVEGIIELTGIATLASDFGLVDLTVKEDIDLTDMVGGGVSLSTMVDELLDIDSLLGMINIPFPLPPINWGRLGSLGELKHTGYPGYTDNIISKRWNVGGNAGNARNASGQVTDVGSPQRLYIRANKPDVMYEVLQLILGYVPELLDAFDLDLDTLVDGLELSDALQPGEVDEQIAALMELVLPRKYETPDVVYKAVTNPVSPVWPPWWDGMFPETPNGSAMAKLDAKYLTDNADILINVLWEALTGKSFPLAVRDIIAPAFDGTMMVGLVDALQGALDGDAVGGIVDMVEMLVRVDKQKLKLSAFFDYPLVAGAGKGPRPDRDNYPSGPAGDTAYQTALKTWIVKDGKLIARPLKAYYAPAEYDVDPPYALVKPAGMFYGDRDYEDDLDDYLEDIGDYFADEVNSVEDFFAEMVEFLKPVSQILDVLMDNKQLDLVNIGDNTGLLKALGGDGFEKALSHLVGAITRPLNIPADYGEPKTADYPLGASDPDYLLAKARWDGRVLQETQPGTRSLAKILYPLTDALNMLFEKPVETLLSVLPNLIYYLTDPQPGASTSPGSPFEQSLNNLLQPLYVLLDTLRPILDITPLLNGLLATVDLPDWLGDVITLDPLLPIHIDLDALVDVLLDELLDGLEEGLPLGLELNLNLRSFLLGDVVYGTPAVPGSEPYDTKTAYLKADSVDRAALLFTLLDQLGLLDLIYDMGMVGVTKLIQYKKFDPPTKIDYGKHDTGNLPPLYIKNTVGGSVTYDPSHDLPTWYRPSHAQYLVDNVDTVLDWAWRELIGKEPVKGILQEMLDELLADYVPGITIEETLGDTINTIWTTDFLKDNFVTLMGLLLGVKDLLGELTIPKTVVDLMGLPIELIPDDVPITQLLAKLIFVHDAERADPAYDENTFWDDYKLAHPTATDEEINTAELLAQGVTPLDLDWILQPVVDFVENPTKQAEILDNITDRDSFMAELALLLDRIVPVLRVFLSESNLLLLRDKRIQSNNIPGTPGGPTTIPEYPGTEDPVEEDYAFLRVYGYDGYNTALLPIFLGVGAAVPGFATEENFMPYDEFRTASGAEQIEAVFTPILFLLDKLAEAPVQTLLQVVPNLAYFLSDDKVDADPANKSLILQAIDKLLYPLTVLLAQLGPKEVAKPGGTELMADADVLDYDNYRAFKASDEYEAAKLEPSYSQAWENYWNYLWEKNNFDNGFLGAGGPLADLLGGADLSNLLGGLLAGLFDDGDGDPTNDPRGLGDYLDGILAGLLEDLVDGFSLNELIMGNIVDLTDLGSGVNSALYDTDYLDELYALGINGGVNYVDVKLADLLTKLLVVLGAFDVEIVQELGANGLFELFNVWDRIPLTNTAGPIDYGLAPPAVIPVIGTFPDPRYAQFLLDNADPVVDWAWETLIFLENRHDDMPLKDYLEGLLFETVGLEIELLPSLEDTVNQILSEELFNQTTLSLIAGLLGSLLGGLDLEIPGLEGLDLFEILKQLIVVGDGASLDITGIIELAAAYTVNADGLVEYAQLVIDYLKDYPGTPEEAALEPDYPDINDYLEEVCAETCLVHGPGEDCITLTLTEAQALSLVAIDKDSFMEALAILLAPLIPVLRVLLTGDSIRLLNVDVTQGWDPDTTPLPGVTNESTGFLVIDGGNGYEYGLLPILMAFGAGLETDGVGGNYDYLDALWTPGALAGATGGQLLAAIIDPLLYLLGALASKPVDTLLRVLPNVAYFIVPGEDSEVSLLSQAINNLLKPIAVIVTMFQSVLGDILPEDLDLADLGGMIDDLLTEALGGFELGDITLLDMLVSLIVGEIKLFPSPFDAVGINTVDYPGEDDKASYIKVKQLELLYQLLAILTDGTLDNSTQELINVILEKLLNGEWNTDPGDPELIDYSVAPEPTTAADLGDLAWLLDEGYADFIVNNLDGLLNWAWSDLLFVENAATETPLATFVEELLSDLTGSAVTLEATLEATVEKVLGEVLFTQGNLMSVVNAVAVPVENLLGMTLGDLLNNDPDIDLTLGELAGALLSIDGEAVDLEGMFAGLLEAYGTPPAIGGRDDFMDALVDILSPLAPVLGVFLLGYDVRVIPMEVDEGRDTGLIKIWGGNGYEYGLLPLLMGIGADLGPEYLDTLWTLEDIETENGGDVGGNLLLAILEPLVALLDALTENPVDTLLSVLPNVAYMLVPDGSNTSILSQGLVNILYPVVNLVKDLDAALLEALGLDVAELLDGIAPAGFELDFGDLGAAVNAILVEQLEQLGAVVGEMTVLDLLRGLVAGERTAFEDSGAAQAPYLEVLGVNGEKGGSDYVAVNQALLVVSLLEATELLALLDDYGGEDLLRVILGLLNGEWNTDPGDPELIDYSVAPEPTAVTYPENLTGPQVQFLVDNVDAVLDWVWAALFADNQPGKQWIVDTLGLGDTLSADSIKDTIDGTVNALLGDLLLTKENLGFVVDVVAELVGDLLGMTLGDLLGEDIDLTLGELASALLSIDGDPVDLDAMFAGFTQYDSTSVTINGLDDFVNVLAEILAPLAPVLGVFLLGYDLRIIPVEVDNGRDTGLIKIWGGNGYEYGLLPLLMGIGADVDGYLDSLWTLDDIEGYAGGAGEGLMHAILEPIVALLNALIEDPVDTLLSVLPNLAYMIVPDADYTSILSQGLVNILYPVVNLVKDLAPALGPLLGVDLEDLLGTLLGGAEVDFADLGAAVNAILVAALDEVGPVIGDMTVLDILAALITGTKTAYADSGAANAAYLEALGVRGVKGGSDYLKVNQADLIVSLLDSLGVFKLLEGLDIGGLGINLIGLIELLNYPGRLRDFLSPIDYPAPNLNTDPYYGWAWTRRDAVSLLGKLPTLLDDLLEMILGSKLDDFLRNLVGDSLYTEKTFKSIVDALQNLLRDVDLTSTLDALIPGLSNVLNNPEAITIGDKPFYLIGAIDALKGFEADAAVNLNSEAGFKSELVRFLAPIVPLLDFLLFGGNPGGPYNDIKILGIPVVDESGNVFDTGVLRAFGYEGYAKGLIPILEALLMPLGLEGELEDLEVLRGLEGEEKLLAILNPLLTAVNEVIDSPLEGLLKLLPSIAYFTGAKNANGKTPLDESLDNVLYALTNLLNMAFGDAVPATLDGLLSFLVTVGVLKEPFSLDVPALLDDLLFDALGIPHLGSALMKNLIVGTPTYYTSVFSGGDALFLSLLLLEDQADLLTVVLRTIIELIQGNKDIRETIVSMLQNLLIKDGNFGSTALHWGLHLILWAGRLLGTQLTLEKFHRFVSFLSWFMPIIRWVLRLFGVLG